MGRRWLKGSRPVVALGMSWLGVPITAPLNAWDEELHLLCDGLSGGCSGLHRVCACAELRMVCAAVVEQVDEYSADAHPVSLDLNKMFSGLSFDGVEEVALGAGQKYSQARNLPWDS